MWIRYRFKTKSVKDTRPLVYNPRFAWWCSGYSGDMKSAIIIAYLPPEEDLRKYWDDAFEIEKEVKSSIKFSSRFPRPTWFEESFEDSIDRLGSLYESLKDRIKFLQPAESMSQNNMWAALDELQQMRDIAAIALQNENKLKIKKA
jgi:hypothetical protein